MKKIFSLAVLFSSVLFSQSIVLDQCTDTTAWKTFQSAGVKVLQQTDQSALRFDVNFTKGSGYGGVFRNFNQSLPENYQISFMMKATVPVNNFEIKVSNDSVGETIWWQNNRSYSYPTEWKRIVIKKRHLSYAWGPTNKPFPTNLKRIEIVVTAGSGGTGSVWIKDLELIPIPLPPNPLPKPIATASSSNATAKNIFAEEKSWKSKSSHNEWLQIDFGYHKEFGAVNIHWDESLSGLQFNVLSSVDGKRFDTLYTVTCGKSGEVTLYTPEADARYLRIEMEKNAQNKNFNIKEVSVVSSDSIATYNNYFEYLAAKSPIGYYPRYFLKQQSYWTVVGVPLDTREALFSEDGVVEVDKLHFSIEPFLESNTQLLSWANSSTDQTLEDGYLPIPTSTRTYDNLLLRTTILARGEAERSSIMMRYVVKNISSLQQKGAFYLTMRPFQVNPSSQFLNITGGFAKTENIVAEKQKANIDDKTVFISSPPTAFGATTIDQGDVIKIDQSYSQNQNMENKKLSTMSVKSLNGMASAAYQYNYDLKPNDSLIIVVAVPFTTEGNIWQSENPTAAQFETELKNVREFWKTKLNTVEIILPKESQKLIDILRTYVGYILINKDKLGYQPGSRSYERSWIRDGSMTSDALMKLGITDEPKKFIDWYSSYQYENGMVPCVVDSRGPDPVPENDSHGELIFVTMEYFRFTKDTTFLRAHWKNIEAAVKYIQFLRGQQMTAAFASGDTVKRSCYGLVTESISHEGYSNKAQHSYWDNFFALKGIKDAAAAGAILGKTEEAKKLDSIAKAYREDFYRSISLGMKNHNIQYIPGCPELGDFDATSTAISLYPAGEMNFLPQQPLHSTFDKYFSFFKQRMNDEIAWDNYTPYEVRLIGSFIYLGEKERAQTLLRWFLRDQRPAGWNLWAEVVDHNKRHARFIGDMPHTWVGSDYINAIRAIFAYEIDDDATLVIGAGLDDDWVRKGVTVKNLPTHYGTLSYDISHLPQGIIQLHITGTIDAKKNPILIPVSLISTPLKKAVVNDVEVQSKNGYIVVDTVPAKIEMTY